MKVSLCTTVKNRLHQIKETLPYNLNSNQHPDVELVILDYWSSDGLEEWMKDNHSLDIEKGKIKYYKLVNPIDIFILTHAINIAFKAAEGEIVCNVDADNFTGKEFGAYLIDFFNKPKMIGASNGGYGLSGRKAFWRQDFIEIIGGYDEDLRYGWGFDEWDIQVRSERLGFEIHYFDNLAEGSYIHHNDEERMKNNLLKKGELWAPHRLHKAISLAKIDCGIYKANPYRQWGHAEVVKNFKLKTIIG